MGHNEEIKKYESNYDDESFLYFPVFDEFAADRQPCLSALNWQ